MRQFVFIIVLLSLSGCGGIDKPKKPENLISQDKMVKILHDLNVLNAAKGVNKKVLELNGISPMDYIYSKYEIDSLQFAESNTFYAYDLKIYKSIIERVKAQLEAEKALYENEDKKEDKDINKPVRNLERSKDSIKLKKVIK